MIVLPFCRWSCVLGENRTNQPTETEIVNVEVGVFPFEIVRNGLCLACEMLTNSYGQIAVGVYEMSK